jgi:REP element-mobilizing transposase RayT
MRKSKSLASRGSKCLASHPKKPPLLPENYYHFYNRGVNRQDIFFCQENWRFFIQQMRYYLQPEFLDIVAYCLMPNHYHLLVYLKTEAISIKVMQPFGTSYVKAVNKQQKRVGPLYQGPFKARHVDTDGYLTHVTRYIHLNPVRARLVEHPADWPYSSYNDYIGLRQGTLPKTDIILSQFASREAYREFVEEVSEPRDREFRQKLELYTMFD